MPTHSLFNGTSHPAPGAWPENVGILAVDIYFPAQYVEQVRFFIINNNFEFEGNR